jgi:hypothetical protein
LTDHLKKAHSLATKEERQPFMKEAFKKTPDMRIQSKCELKQSGMHIMIYREIEERSCRTPDMQHSL